MMLQQRSIFRALPPSVFEVVLLGFEDATGSRPDRHDSWRLKYRCAYRLARGVQSDRDTAMALRIAQPGLFDFADGRGRQSCQAERGERPQSGASCPDRFKVALGATTQA